MRDEGPPVKDFIERLQAQDKEAIDIFYDRYATQIYGVINRLIPDKHEREVIFIKVFKLALDKISQFESSKSSFFIWLYRIVITEVLEWHERKKTS